MWQIQTNFTSLLLLPFFPSSFMDLQYIALTVCLAYLFLTNNITVQVESLIQVV